MIRGSKVMNIQNKFLRTIENLCLWFLRKRGYGHGRLPSLYVDCLVERHNYELVKLVSEADFTAHDEPSHIRSHILASLAPMLKDYVTETISFDSRRVCNTMRLMLMVGRRQS